MVVVRCPSLNRTRRVLALLVSASPAEDDDDDDDDDFFIGLTDCTDDF